MSICHHEDRSEIRYLYMRIYHLVLKGTQLDQMQQKRSCELVTHALLYIESSTLLFLRMSRSVTHST